MVHLRDRFAGEGDRGRRSRLSRRTFASAERVAAMTDVRPHLCEACKQPVLDSLQWEWGVSSINDRDERFTARYRGTNALDLAYDYAEKLIADGAARVAILLTSNGGISWGVADTCDGSCWVVGRERWRANEAQAIEEGRARSW